MRSSVLPCAVRRALEAMRADLSRDWTVLDLATAAGVSGRTLQRLFRAFLDKTPGAALRDIRFECARRELLQGLPGTRVTDVALRCGFPHCGRFSVEYRRRYGEMPSGTLKRQTTLIGTLASASSVFPIRRDRPTIALGPIDASPENGELARSVADEIATALTRAGLSVTQESRSARYHLTGAMRESGKQARLTMRLTERETGLHLWAHRSEGARGEGFAREEHLATRIAVALNACLRLAEIERAQGKSDVDLSAHDLTLRAMPHALSLDAGGNARALDLLDRATDRDPDNALASALAAWVHAQRVVYHFGATPHYERTRSMDLVRKALALARESSVFAVLGNALTALHDLETAELVVRKALSLDGGSAWAWGRSGWIDVYKGDSGSAIERFMIALDLAPHDPLAFNNFVGMGCAHFHAGRYRDAARLQERALLEHPSAAWIHRTLCPAYVLGNAPVEARRSFAALREHYPDLTLSDVETGLPPLPQTYRNLVFGALHAVGLPT